MGAGIVECDVTFTKDKELLERSGILADGDNGFYYQTFDSAIRREGDMMKVLDVLGREIGILGIFSDWPATVTYYANCMKLR
jgi:glycerophosphoryl diester phosphodiesterase